MNYSDFFIRLFGHLGNIHRLWWFIIKLLEYPYLRLLGVRIPFNVSFKGWCHFYKCESSKIYVGESCVFNSSSSSNHIGMNRNCSVSTLKKGASVLIGNNVGFSSSNINAFLRITIGNNVRVGANCVIMDGDFHLDDPRTGPPAPIVIEDNVWLGYGVIVMKGVTIGANSVIGANSIVTKDIPANVVAAGSPCKVIRNI